MLRTAARILAVVLLPVLLVGCGFLASGQRGANKPDGFPLRGYVSVGGLPASAPASVCHAPPGFDDIRAGGAVRVADEDGRTLAAGQLSPGVFAVEAGAARCDFPFEITAVPGGVDRYVIGVGNRPARTFPADDLRQNKPAVLTLP